MALAGTPALVVLRLQKEIAAALLKLQMQHFLATQGARGIEIKTLNIPAPLIVKQTSQIP